VVTVVGVVACPYCAGEVTVVDVVVDGVVDGALITVVPAVSGIVTVVEPWSAGVDGGTVVD
jgi:uncharacterized Fe-S cluster-containing radical SAM superfamily enzyme